MMPSRNSPGGQMNPEDLEDIRERYQEIEDRRLARVEEKAGRLIEIAKRVAEDMDVEFDHAMEATMVSTQSVPTSILDLSEEDLQEAPGIGGEIH